MAVVIRMKRTGRRNRPCYRISVADRALAPTGRVLDNLGLYDPASPKADLRLKLNVERAKEWLAKGALPSETVHSIFKREGVYEGRPERKVRKRPGRKKVTATKTTRRTAQSERETKKKARRDERLQAKYAARKEARAAAAAEGGDE